MSGPLSIWTMPVKDYSLSRRGRERKGGAKERGAIVGIHTFIGTVRVAFVELSPYAKGPDVVS